MEEGDLFGDLPAAKHDQRSEEKTTSFAVEALQEGQKRNQKRAEHQAPAAEIAPTTVLKRQAGVTVSPQSYNNQSLQEETKPQRRAPSQAEKDVARDVPVPVERSEGMPSSGRPGIVIHPSVEDEYVPSKPNDFRVFAEWLREQYRQFYGGPSWGNSDNKAGETIGNQAWETSEGEWEEHGTGDWHDREMAEGGERTDQASEEGNAQLETGKKSGLGAAQKMMEKMGWNPGQGLGKEEQGIKEPLIVRKHDKWSGTIEDKNPKSKDQNADDSRIVLLTNVVGRGQVDQDLEDEVADECENFGDVVRCTIFEVTDTEFPDEEAVRIFVEFEQPSAARTCADRMEGRFFGGRRVSACLFSEQRYANNELAPWKHERSSATA